MGRDKEFAVTELDRRLANILRLGTVEEADYAKARVRIRCGDLLTGWLPWMTGRAGKDLDWWAPDIGEQVMVLSPSGEPAQGAVLLGAYQDSAPAPETDGNKRTVVFEDGTKVTYDRSAHKLDVLIKGEAEVVIKGNTTLRVEGHVDLTVTDCLHVVCEKHGEMTL